MLVVSVMYPAGKFDHGYYGCTHLPLVRERWGGMGLQDIRVLRGTDGPDGAPPAWQLITMMNFDSMDALKQAVGAHGREIFADIPNFTDGTPVVQCSEPVDASA